MMIYLKRILFSLLIIVAYFTIWKTVRGIVTTEIVVPQIEYAISNCDDTIAFDQLKSTSIQIHLLDREYNQYETFAYTAPGGFYLLFGLIFIMLFGGKKHDYYWLVGFHIIFWFLSTLTILPGLCYYSAFIHFTFVGIKYITPFFTFLILILVVSPGLRTRMESSHR